MIDWRERLRKFLETYQPAPDPTLDEWERDRLRRRAQGDMSGSVRPEVMQRLIQRAMDEDE